jgi:hypothetical protein
VTIIEEPLPHASLRRAYRFALRANIPVEPQRFLLESGALPEGVSLGENGVISGTPRAVGSYTFTVRLTVGTGGSSVGQFTLVVERDRIWLPLIRR